MFEPASLQIWMAEAEETRAASAREKVVVNFILLWGDIVLLGKSRRRLKHCKRIGWSVWLWRSKLKVRVGSWGYLSVSLLLFVFSIVLRALCECSIRIMSQGDIRVKGWQGRRPEGLRCDYSMDFRPELLIFDCISWPYQEIKLLIASYPHTWPINIIRCHR